MNKKSFYRLTFYLSASQRVPQAALAQKGSKSSLFHSPPPSFSVSLSLGVYNVDVISSSPAGPPPPPWRERMSAERRRIQGMAFTKVPQDVSRGSEESCMSISVTTNTKCEIFPCFGLSSNSIPVAAAIKRSQVATRTGERAAPS